MRSIQISTPLFAKIWSHRREGEEDENAILERLLGVPLFRDGGAIAAQPERAKDRKGQKVLWRDDVAGGLETLGGQASLNDLYNAVRDIRRKAGRSLPKNTEAIIRRELENNSSDSEVFMKRFDLFRSVNGIGNGIWALR